MDVPAASRRAGRRGAAPRDGEDGMLLRARPITPPARTKEHKLLTVDDVRELLRAEIDKAGTQTAWARRARVNRSIACAILAGKKTLQPKIVKALGLKKVIAYTRA
jgi:hypothetical protein